MSLTTQTSNIQVPAPSRRKTLQTGLAVIVGGLVAPAVAQAASAPAAAADAELCQLATAHEKACVEILRLENTKCAADEDYVALDDFREIAVERAAELHATTPAGARAKAAILVAEAGILWSRSMPAHERLGLSLAHDINGGAL